jgi:predicted TPR repeat methyltransferase
MGKREKEKAAARAAAAATTPASESPVAPAKKPVPNAIAPGQTAPGRVAVGMAAQLFEAGQLELAESTCRAVLSGSPDDPDATHLLGIIQGELGRLAEAVITLERAVALCPGHPAAWLNLGITRMRVSATDGEECFRKVLEIDPSNAAARGNLATVLEKTGRLGEAEHELRVLLRDNPRDTVALGWLARVARLRGQFATEVRALKALLGLEPDNPKVPPVLRRAYFLWYYAVDKDVEKSLEVLTEWLAYAPDDPVALHMHASRAAGGATPDRASPGYVESHFDEFADSFDSVLTKLGYRAPEIVRDLLAKVVPVPAANLDIVDIGCGTGRLGPLILGWKKTLVGVDLSQKMLDRAGELKVYESLCHADVTPFLTERPKSFNVAVCVDTLVYFGDLGALFRATFETLRDDGWFLGTVEELDSAATEPQYKLHGGGRYAHKEAYLREVLAKSGFGTAEVTRVELRLELGVPVHGFAFAARRAQA